MMNNISSRTCGNVYSILTEMKLFNKIPEDKQNYIINHKGKYRCKFNKNIPLQFQIDDKETMVVLSYLFLKYINDNADTKRYLINKYKSNEIIYQKELREKYNPDNIFKNVKKENKNTRTIINNEVTLVEVNDNLISRIIKKIKNLFKRK